HHDNTGTELGSLHGLGEPHVEAKRLNKQAGLIRDFLTRSESELIPIPLKPRTVAWKHWFPGPHFRGSSSRVIRLVAVEFWRMGATPVPSAEIDRLARAFEDAGWDGLAVGEAHGLIPDPYVVLAVAAA